jgi:carboxynorspermidine decarboxylase
MTVALQFDQRLLPLYIGGNVNTPAFVYDEAAISARLELLSDVRRNSGCHILYSVKAASFPALLQRISHFVDGFSVSSLFEARLVQEILGRHEGIHLVSPCLKQHDAADIANTCDHVSFNSLAQWQRFHSLATRMYCGLRINPELSFLSDERYDPCRPSSKLGVPLSELTSRSGYAEQLRGITGIHVHNNCDSQNFRELEQTVNKLVQSLTEIMPEVTWINMGGGYQFNDPAQVKVLADIAGRLRSTHGLEVYFEPGRAIVENAGYLVASVVDMFTSGTRTIAVLDTTVNHLPEVFEYQFKPGILRESPQGRYTYRLAGASCLSGDLFGDYSFDEPLEINSRVVFTQVGAYMLVKANMFNGINLPDVYLLDQNGTLELLKRYTYSHYRDRL